jgi:hypothetical protein
MSWIVAQWTVPNVYLPANAVDGQWYSAFSWVGLDGAGSNDVLLAGYSSGVMTSGGVLHRLAGPIWGWVPDHDHVIMNFPIAEGDRISVMVGRSSAKQGYIIMNNDTALTQTGLQVTAPTGTSLVGSSAECVIDRSSIYHGPPKLARYGEVLFEQVGGETANRVNLHTLTWNPITMTVDGTPSGQKLSLGTIEGPSQVKCSYAGP